MNFKNVLNCKNRKEFRDWLFLNHDKEDECYLELKRGKPVDNTSFYYLDAIEEALCFGWIDSCIKKVDNKSLQRFSPRRKDSYWSILNLERVKRLEKLGLMDDSGRATLPKNKKKLEGEPEIIELFKKNKIWSKFKKFPLLYQKIRIYNLLFYKKINNDAYLKMLDHTIKTTKEGKTFGEWNDYGRLLNY